MLIALCNRTRNIARPWLEAGLPVVTVDILPADRDEPGREHIQTSILALDEAWIRSLRPSMVAAFPPCTHLAGSGARWFRSKGLDAVIEALTLVNHCRKLCEASGARWFLENPVGTLSHYWREPDYTFHPAHYAGYSPDPDEDAYTKKTCLWTGGGFVMPDRKPVDPVQGSKMHLLPPSDDRADLRSVTPLGFSYAVFRANALEAAA